MDWSAILSGGLAVAIVQGLYTIIMWWLNRQADKKDHESDDAKQSFEDIDKRLDSQDAKLDGCTYGLRILLHDRIKFLGQKYLQDGEIDFDDRQIFLDMHNAYHNGLDGNGNLDELVKAVRAIPLKGEKKYGDK